MTLTQCVECAEKGIIMAISTQNSLLLQHAGWRWLPWKVAMVVEERTIYQHAWFCLRCAQSKASGQNRNE